MTINSYKNYKKSREKQLYLIMYITEPLKKYELQKCWAALTPFCKNHAYHISKIVIQDYKTS